MYSTYRTFSNCKTGVLYIPYCLYLNNLCTQHTVLSPSLQSVFSTYRNVSICTNCVVCTLHTVLSQSVYSTFRTVSIWTICVLSILFCIFMHNLCTLRKTCLYILYVQSVYSTYRTLSICITCLLYTSYHLNTYNICTLNTVLSLSLQYVFYIPC